MYAHCWSDNTLYWGPAATGTNRVSANAWSAATAIPFLWGLTSSTTIATLLGRSKAYLPGLALQHCQRCHYECLYREQQCFLRVQAQTQIIIMASVRWSSIVVPLRPPCFNKVQSPPYMAIKCGITWTALTYVNSSGTTIYGTTTTHASLCAWYCWHWSRW